MIAVTKNSTVLVMRRWTNPFRYVDAAGTLILQLNQRQQPTLPAQLTGTDGATYVLRQVNLATPSGTPDRYTKTTESAPTLKGDVVTVPRSHVDMPFERAIEVAKAAATEAYRRHVAEGLLFNGVRVNTSNDAVLELEKAMEKVADGSTLGVVTRSGDKIDLDTATVSALMRAVTDYKLACIARERALYDAIDAAGDMTELRAIELDTGWPM